jgi:hypothetical protein
MTSFRSAFLRQIMVLRDRVHVGLDFLPVCLQEQPLKIHLYHVELTPTATQG